jgi:hypothetical protein
MRKKERIQSTVYKEIATEITCNRCGAKKDVMTNYNPLDVQDFYQEISLSFPPHSMFSNQHWKFDLCDECLLTIVRDFKLVPEGFMKTALPNRFPQLQFDNWKQTGKWDWRYGYSDDMLMSMGILPESQIKFHISINDEKTYSTNRAKEIANKIIESLKKKGGQL